MEKYAITIKVGGLTFSYRVRAEHTWDAREKGLKIAEMHKGRVLCTRIIYGQ